MTKIAGMLGPVLRVDNATMNKDKMLYARVLVDLNKTKGFHDAIYYENELGELVTQQVLYDWKPSWCSTCKQMGHATEMCKVEKPEPVATKAQPSMDFDGFQLVQYRQSFSQGPNRHELILKWLYSFLPLLLDLLIFCLPKMVLRHLMALRRTRRTMLLMSQSRKRWGLTLIPLMFNILAWNVWDLNTRTK